MSGGGGGGNTTSTTQNYSPEEAARRTKVMDEAERLYNSTSSQIANSPYPGAQVTPFSQATVDAQNLAVKNAGQAQQGIDQINAGVKYGLSDSMDVSKNPYLQNAIQAAINPITQKYTDPGGVMSQIRTGAQETGQYGGSRQGIAEGIAAGRYSQEVGDVASKMANDGYLSGQQTFQRTLAFAPQALETNALPVNWLSSVGAQQENLAQQQEDYNANARQWDLNSDWMPLQNYANIVYGGGSSMASTSSSTPGPQRQPVMGMLGGAAAGAYVGSVVPGIGTAVGAGVGALMGLLAS